MPGDDRRDHKLTNFGKLKLEGFGPEATETAPVSAQLHNAINDISLLVYLQPLLHMRSESYRIRWNYAEVRAITPFKVIQGHRVWYQSKGHMRLAVSD